MTETSYSRTGKRIFDVLLSAVGLLLIFPLLVAVAVAVRLSSSGPVFFRQIRLGRFGRPFHIWKFRSMKVTNDGPRVTAAGDPRVTRIGKWLRATKIDEIPQLFNVLAGQMSLVGPRPEVPEFAAHYSAQQRRVLDVVPGMTGLSADIYEEELLAHHGEDRESFYISAVMPCKLAIDLEYCANITFAADVRILFRTFSKLADRLFQTPRTGARHSHIPLEPSASHDEAQLFDPDRLKRYWLYTKTNQMILDGCGFALALFLAYLTHFDARLSTNDIHQLVLALPVIVAVRLIIQQLLSIYKQVWKFVSFSDVLEIAKSVFLGSLVFLSAKAASRAVGFHGTVPDVPSSVLILEGLLSLSSCLALRAVRRLLYTRQRKVEAAAGNAPPVRVFLYGAGRAGIMLRKELETNNNYDVIGFVDDDPHKVGSTISKTPVVGSGQELPNLVEKYKVDQVIISMATASRMTLSRALARCRRANVSAKIIPSFPELLSGRVQISQIRDTKVEDVLGRDSVEVPNFEQLAGASYRGRRILVTGAGGSIGSEAVRQLTRLAPASIAALDIDENAIYDLQQELLLHKATVPLQGVICNVNDRDRLHAVFASVRPDIVIHAAAHKHVPLMELQPCEAILNNVGGTKNVLELGHELRVERLVFISSDKAVNPVNVMGATKRIGELLVQGYSQGSCTRSACVRFGNVLGSQGSVIPLFKKQIESGGPITITHPDMVRYFMTVQEAVQLVLCAGTLADGGHIFVLDMGKPRRILELAREMILLAGLEPERDIETVCVGLRPGEKLWEDLVAPNEHLHGTAFDKLSVIEPQQLDSPALFSNVARLLQYARKNDVTGLQEMLHSMGLGYSAPSAAPKTLSAAASQNSFAASGSTRVERLHPQHNQTSPGYSSREHV